MFLMELSRNPESSIRKLGQCDTKKCALLISCLKTKICFAIIFLNQGVTKHTQRAFLLRALRALVVKNKTTKAQSHKGKPSFSSCSSHLFSYVQKSFLNSFLENEGLFVHVFYIEYFAAPGNSFIDLVNFN